MKITPQPGNKGTRFICLDLADSRCLQRHSYRTINLRHSNLFRIILYQIIYNSLIQTQRFKLNHSDNLNLGHSQKNNLSVLDHVFPNVLWVHLVCDITTPSDDYPRGMKR